MAEEGIQPLIAWGRRVALDATIRAMLRQRNAAVWHLFDSVYFAPITADYHAANCGLCQRGANEIRTWQA